MYYKRYQHRWNIKNSLQATPWFLEQRKCVSAKLDLSKFYKRRRSDDTWLEEQSIMADSDFKEAIDVDITNDDELKKMSKKINECQKRSRA